VEKAATPTVKRLPAPRAPEMGRLQTADHEHPRRHEKDDHDRRLRPERNAERHDDEDLRERRRGHSQYPASAFEVR
jgi:hypothetical protein